MADQDVRDSCCAQASTISEGVRREKRPVGQDVVLNRSQEREKEQQHMRVPVGAFRLDRQRWSGGTMERSGGERSNLHDYMTNEKGSLADASAPDSIRRHGD